MTLRAPLVRISGKIVDLPASDTIGGAPAGPTGADGSAPLTTKGDLLTFSTVVTALGVGADGTVLTADSAQARGIKWGTVTAGVSSVSNSDGTLTISPTTGAVVASLALGHANTWTAKQTFRASTTSASTAGIYLQSGTLMSTAEVGAVEFLTDKYYATITTGAARKELALWDAAGTSGRVPYETTNGRLTDTANLAWNNGNVTLTLGGAAGSAAERIYATSTANSGVGFVNENLSTGTAGYAGIFVRNSVDTGGMTYAGTGFTVSGVLGPSTFQLYNNLSGKAVNLASNAGVINFSVDLFATARMRIEANGDIKYLNAGVQKYHFDTVNSRFNFLEAVTTAGNDFYYLKAQNAQTGVFFQNNSTGAAGSVALAAFNSANYIGLFKYSTGFTTAGLLTAGTGSLFTDSGNLLIGPIAASVATIFVTGGTAAANERMRIDSSGITIADAHNIVVNTSTGTKIGTGTTQKIGFWNATPIAQKTGYGTPTGNVNQGSFAAGSITLPNLAAHVAQLCLDLKAAGLIGA
jgi:hypothetical protein